MLIKIWNFSHVYLKEHTNKYKRVWEHLVPACSPRVIIDVRTYFIISFDKMQIRKTFSFILLILWEMIFIHDWAFDWAFLKISNCIENTIPKRWMSLSKFSDCVKNSRRRPHLMPRPGDGIPEFWKSRYTVKSIRPR